MQKVDEYLRYAKHYRAEADKATGPERAQYARIAEEWERLAKYRLEVLQLQYGDGNDEGSGGDGNG